MKLNHNYFQSSKKSLRNNLRFLSSRESFRLFYAVKKGFTLVEILLVVLIIAALSAMVVPRFVGKSERAKVSIAGADVAQIATALKLYEMENGHFPATSQGLKALYIKPTSGSETRTWDGPYIEKEAVDPWGEPYVYISPGKHKSDYDLYSIGKDPDSNEDDITNWD